MIPFDFEDVFANTLGRVALFCVFMVSAIWAGSLLGAIALGISHFISPFIPGASAVGVGFDAQYLWYSPLLLLSVWLVPNVGFVGLSIAHGLVSDKTGYRLWGIIFGVESLFAMLGWAELAIGQPWRAWLAWSVWALLLGMTETGVWLIHALQRNQFVHELEELKRANAQRHAERDAARERAASPDGANLN